MLRTQKPPQLQPGDTVAAISLSWGGPGTFPHRYQAGKRQFEQAFGVHVVETRHALRDADWLARNPQARADDLMEAFSDPALRGVISTIGGDDSIRILRHLDLGVLRANPKVFVGYSDTTVSHFACLAAGLTSFYGPSFMGGFGENAGIHPYLEQSFRRTVMSAAAPGVIEPSAAWTVEHLPWAEPELQDRPRALRPSQGWRFHGQGCVRGPLIGGCIEVLEWLKGTPVWPEPERWDGAVLFLETSEEAPPASDVRRWLRSYGAQGILDRVGAVLLGRPGGAELPVEEHARYEEALVEVVREELGLGLPLVTGMDFGHTDPFFTLPYGVMAEVDCDVQRFAVIEPACTARSD